MYQMGALGGGRILRSILFWVKSCSTMLDLVSEHRAIFIAKERWTLIGFEATRLLPKEQAEYLLYSGCSVDEIPSVNSSVVRYSR